MNKDLTNSDINRQNILNNPYALEKIEVHFAFPGKQFEGQTVFTKADLARLFEVDDRTIERCIAQHGDELGNNGYQVLRGISLKNYRLSDVSDTDVGDKAPSLGVFNFRALLNIAMLLTESERAKEIRSRILDIVMDVVAEKAGGHTQFINQRDQDFLPAAYQEFSYRESFTSALNRHVDAGRFKYANYTNKIYQIIFRENAAEYRQVLRLGKNESVRESMYAEVLNLIASFENGVASQIEQKAQELGRKLSGAETDELFVQAETNPYLQPFIHDARTRMASRDLCFRDALHDKLQSYVQAVPKADFEKFLGKTSKALEDRLKDEKTLAVFKRLKDR
ncbi:MAG: DNA-binding protein [Candidatus Nitrotoga sp.]|nr:DNA-binding protein [Candidatus Nitrotoga sp.]